MPHPPKLPVWKTTRECYRLVFAHAGDFIRISWLWVLVMIPVYAAAHAAIWYLTESPDSMISSFRLKSLVSMFPNVLEAGFLSAVAVSWHQLILVRHAPTTAPLILGRTVLLYAVWGFALFLLPCMIWTFMLPSEDIPTAWTGIYVVTSIIMLPIITILPLRFSLKLPAIALGHDTSLTQSFQQTRRNTLRLSLTAVVCWLPALLIMIAIAYALPDISQTPDLATYVAVSTVMSYTYAIPAILGITWLSLIYRHFVLTPHPLDSHGNPS